MTAAAQNLGSAGAQGDLSPDQAAALLATGLSDSDLRNLGYQVPEHPADQSGTDDAVGTGGGSATDQGSTDVRRLQGQVRSYETQVKGLTDRIADLTTMVTSLASRPVQVQTTTPPAAPVDPYADLDVGDDPVAKAMLAGLKQVGQEIAGIKASLGSVAQTEEQRRLVNANVGFLKEFADVAGVAWTPEVESTIRGFGVNDLWGKSVAYIKSLKPGGATSPEELRAEGAIALAKRLGLYNENRGGPAGGNGNAVEAQQTLNDRFRRGEISETEYLRDSDKLSVR